MEDVVGQEPTDQQETVANDDGEGEVDNGVLKTVEKTPEETTSKEEEKKEVLTEKGTKLDPNPESAVHQKLANAEKRLKDYETVLRSPELLRKYAKDAHISLTEAKEEIKDAKDDAEEFSADKFQTAEDIAKALNALRSGFNTKTKESEKIISDLQAEIKGLAEVRQVESVQNTIKQDISEMREKYPELNPKSSSYNPKLEEKIGKLFADVDFDEQKGAFKGKTSIAKIADAIMESAVEAKKKGSEEAQTVIKERNAGKIVTSEKATKKTESESEDAGTTIASRIANAVKGSK